MANEFESFSLVGIAERISTAGHALGIWAGYSEAAVRLRTLAGEHYSKGNDQMASFYRNAAEDLERKAKEQRVRYDDKFKTSSSEAFAELERRETALIT